MSCLGFVKKSYSFLKKKYVFNKSNEIILVKFYLHADKGCTFDDIFFHHSCDLIFLVDCCTINMQNLLAIRKAKKEEKMFS